MARIKSIVQTEAETPFVSAGSRYLFHNADQAGALYQKDDVGAFTAVGSGGGSGTVAAGTVGKIPVYTAATTVGNSEFFQDPINGIHSVGLPTFGAANTNLVTTGANVIGDNVAESVLLSKAGVNGITVGINAYEVVAIGSATIGSNFIQGIVVGSEASVGDNVSGGIVIGAEARLDDGLSNGIVVGAYTQSAASGGNVIGSGINSGSKLTNLVPNTFVFGINTIVPNVYVGNEGIHIGAVGATPTQALEIANGQAVHTRTLVGGASIVQGYDLINEITAGTQSVQASAMRADAIVSGAAIHSGLGIDAISGIHGAAIMQTTGAVAQANGITGIVQVNGVSAGLVSAAYGIAGIVANTSDGHITNGASIFAGEITNLGAGQIDSAYGIYVANQTQGAIANYGMYIAGGATSSLRVAAGIVTINDLAGASTQMVTVNAAGNLGSQPIAGLLSITRILTPLEIKDLHNNAIEIIPAPGAGKAIHVVNGHGTLDFNTIAYSSGLLSTIRFFQGAFSLNSAVITKAFVTQAVPKSFWPFTSTGILGQGNVNTNVTLFNTSDPFTLGDSSIPVTLYYRIIDI